MKKLLSILLATVLLLTCIPLGAISVSAGGVTPDYVKSQLDNFKLNATYKPGNTPPSSLYRSGTSGCFGFVDLLCRKIFGHNLASQKSAMELYTTNFTKIGSTLSKSAGNLSESSLKSLLSNAKTGDVVQMDYTTYSGEDSRHTMMVYSVSSQGVVFYHAGSSKIYFGQSSGSQPLWGTTGNVLTWANLYKCLRGNDDGISMYRSTTVSDSHTHTYSNACDTTCNTCGAARSTTHTYTGANDATCNVCGATRTMCTVSFDVNGGQGNITPLSIAPGEKVTIWVNSPKRSGHIFVGWSEAADGSGYIYPYGSTYSVTKNVTLYAVWKKDTTTIAYDADGNVYYRSYVIDGVNKGRGTAKTILYNRSYGSTTGTNEYGVEATVDATGKVLYHVYGVGNATIPMDGFVLSAHISEGNLFVLDHISVGDYVYFDSAVNTIYVFSTKAKKKAFLNCKDGHLGNQVVKNRIIATCEEEGYTGDICCSKCNEVIKVGAMTAKGEHVWENGSCVVCNTQPSTKVAITTQPKTTYTQMGKKTSVSVKASGDGLKYQWYFKNAGAKKYSKSSNTTSVYETKMSSASKNRMVYCVVTDKYGNTIKSDTKTLREAVSITTQPKTTYTKKGATTKVTVKASGDGLKYQWYFKKAGATKYSKSSNTTSVYDTKMSSASKNRMVYCVVTDKYGNKVKSDTKTLREAVSITTQPKTVTVKKNTTAKVSVKASGDGLKYTWYVKNAGSTKYVKSSITKSTYSVKMTAKTKNRLVYCVVTDKYGKTVKTVTVKLKMK